MTSLYFICFIVGVAFIFDFVNGFHDASNSIATVVSTGVLKPRVAVLWAAFFNFIAFLFFHLNVATTFGVGLVSPAIITPYVILATLLGAISFNLITWYLGLPSSSSHALIGALVGAALAKNGTHSMEWLGLSKTLLAIFISPVLGMIVSFFILRMIKKILRDHHTHFNRSFQLISAALLSLGHGGNDAQKTMGIIALLLFSANLIGPHFHIPFWVIISCNLVMGLGTFAGGWRIVKTMGEKITPLTPQRGAAAETGSALVLFLATQLGIPVSTTHIVTGSIIGVGLKNTYYSPNWILIKRICFAWLLTLPCSALLAATFVYIFRF